MSSLKCNNPTRTIRCRTSAGIHQQRHHKDLQLTGGPDLRTITKVAAITSHPRDISLCVTRINTAPSFNGRTSDSDSLDRGSNPWGATIRFMVANSLFPLNWAKVWLSVADFCVVHFRSQRRERRFVNAQARDLLT